MEDRHRQTSTLPKLAQEGKAEHAAGRTITLNLQLSPRKILVQLFARIQNTIQSLWRILWRSYNQFEKLILLRLPKPIAKRLYRLRPKRREHPLLTRVGWGFMALLMVSTLGIDTLHLRTQEVSYALSPKAEQLLGEQRISYADRLDRKSVV